METKNDLFSIKTKENFPVWDIIRHDIWNYIISNSIQNNYSNQSKVKEASFNFKAIFTFFKYLIIFSFSFFKRNRILYIGFSRFKNHENKLQDNYFKILVEQLPKNYKFSFYEVFINKSNYDNTKRIYDIIYYLNKFYRKSLIEIETLEKIKNIVDQTFERDTISIYEIQKILSNFYIEYKLFSILIKWKKIKCVFLVSSFKGLCLAAKDNNIPTFEFQHGDIVQTTIHYNYSNKCFSLDKNNFIFPDVLYTYSNKWIQNNNLFSECIELGKVNLFLNESSMFYKKDIAIISSPGHYDKLKTFAIELSKNLKDLTIYFKLHPMENELLDNTINYFSNYSNIIVVEGAADINILYKSCSHFIAIYSSVLYEAHEYQNFVYILKELNYWNYSNFLELENVFLFSNFDEFLQTYRKNSQILKKSQNFSHEYYKKFNPNVLIDQMLRISNY